MARYASLIVLYHLSCSEFTDIQHFEAYWYQSRG